MISCSDRSDQSPMSMDTCCTADLRTTSFPPGLRTDAHWPKEASLPTHSRHTSTPSPPVRSIARRWTSSVEALITVSAPASRARWRRVACRSDAITAAAPDMRATCVLKSPVVPAPHTSTDRPFTCARSTPFSTVGRRVAMAPSSKLMPFGNFTTWYAGTLWYSDRPPSVWQATTRSPCLSDSTRRPAVSMIPVKLRHRDAWRPLASDAGSPPARAMPRRERTHARALTSTSTSLQAGTEPLDTPGSPSLSSVSLRMAASSASFFGMGTTSTLRSVCCPCPSDGPP